MSSVKYIRPMKGEPLETVTWLRLPALGSPKIDGIRATVQHQTLCAASLKPIPNRHTQEMFRHIPHPLDGELKLGEPWEDNFRATSSAVMRHHDEPDIKFYVFDLVLPKLDAIHRLAELNEIVHKLNNPNVIIVPHEIIVTQDQAIEFHERNLALGFEGTMYRWIESPYKSGRSTVAEGYLFKMKDFDDSEAIVLECMPLLDNQNVSEYNELGLKRKSLAKANRHETAKLGSFYAKDIKTGVEFYVGTGFTGQQRLQYWEDRAKLIGRPFTYRFLKTGMYDKPRNLSFKGFRDPIDMSDY